MKAGMLCVMTAVLTVQAFFFAGTACAIVIAYEVKDIDDVVPYEDLWQYTYTVSDYDFEHWGGFTVDFEYGLCKSITPVTGSEDWDLVAWDPATVYGVPDAGGYGALALRDGAVLPEVLVVNFAWLDEDSRPGPQYFEVYDAEGNTEPYTTVKKAGEFRPEDIVRCLKMLAGMPETGLHSASDISGDGKIGTEEIVHALRNLADAGD